jgi:hypothetical protein
MPATRKRNNKNKTQKKGRGKGKKMKIVIVGAVPCHPSIIAKMKMRKTKGMKGGGFLDFLKGAPSASPDAAKLEQEKLEEQRRLADEAKRAEEKRLADEAKLAEQKSLAVANQSIPPNNQAPLPECTGSFQFVKRMAGTCK